MLNLKGARGARHFRAHDRVALIGPPLVRVGAWWMPLACPAVPQRRRAQRAGAEAAPGTSPRRPRVSPCPAPAGCAGGCPPHLDCQALARVLVQHHRHPQRAAVGRPVLHEVHAPHLVLPHRPSAHDAVLARADPPAFPRASAAPAGLPAATAASSAALRPTSAPSAANP